MYQWGHASQREREGEKEKERERELLSEGTTLCPTVRFYLDRSHIDMLHTI